jgi:hypothetical protein
MSESELARRLQELSDLYAKGAITAEEFAAAKATVLAQPDRSATPSATVSDRPGGVTGTPRRRQPPGSGLSGHSGAVTSAVAGLVVLVAFLAMPMATVPFFGSLTGVGMAGEASEMALLGLLWLVPLAATGIVGLAVTQILAVAAPSARRARSAAIIGLAVLVWLVYAVVLGSVQDKISEVSGIGGFRLNVSVTDFLASGVWFAVLAAGVAGVGAWLEMTSGRHRDGSAR